MIISKKLLLIATFGLCIPFNASAIHTTIEIDLNNEMSIIESYMPLLRQQPTIGAEKVVQWLDKKLQQQSLKKHDAITIANILTTNTSINSKVADILQIIRIKEVAKADKARVASQQKRKSIMETVAVCGMFALFGGLIVLDAILNPYKFREPDSITTIRKYGNHTISTTNYWPYNNYNYSYDPYYNPVVSYCYKPTPNLYIRIR